jgi:hypothetical protein
MEDILIIWNNSISYSNRNLLKNKITCESVVIFFVKYSGTNWNIAIPLLHFWLSFLVDQH